MLVRTLEQLRADGRDVLISGGSGSAIRLVTQADRLGFSVADARARTDVDTDLWYKHHVEANYLADGEGEVVDRASGKSWPLRPGTLYCVGPTDRHTLRIGAGSRIIAIFSPALVGDETHDADGGYPPTGEVPSGWGSMFVRTLDELRTAGHEKVVAGGTARTVRMITAADGMGFSLSDVSLDANLQNELWYKNHWEANYILEGEADVVDIGTGETHHVAPGTLYVVGPDDRHSVRTCTELHAISIFNPPLVGDEQHDEDGALAASGPLPLGPPG